MLELIKGNGMEGSDIMVRGGPAFKSSDEPGFIKFMEDGTLKVNGFLGNAKYRDDVFIEEHVNISLVEGESYVSIAEAGLVDIVLTFIWKTNSVITNTVTMVNIKGLRLSGSSAIKGVNMAIWNPDKSLKTQINSSHAYLPSISNDAYNTNSLAIISSGNSSSYPQFLTNTGEKARLEFLLQASDFSQISF
jgi:hypothetical protein